MPDGELRPATQALAERIAANAPLSVMAVKQTVYLAMQQGLGEAFDQADRLCEPAYLSADAQEGPAAFRAKRPPVWTGRRGPAGPGPPLSRPARPPAGRP